MNSETVLNTICYYCQQTRNVFYPDYLCEKCLRWVHKSCLSIVTSINISFPTNYTFHCKECCEEGEIFATTSAEPIQVCVTTLANLQVTNNKKLTFFSKENEIFPFILKHVAELGVKEEYDCDAWQSRISQELVKNIELFDSKLRSDESHMCDTYFSLKISDLFCISPPYGVDVPKAIFSSLSDSQNDKKLNSLFSIVSNKKRPLSDSPLLNKKVKVFNANSALSYSPDFYPSEYPFNKDNYRYVYAEIDPHAPFKTEFEEGQDWAGKPIPGFLYRPVLPSNVLLSLNDRGSQLKLSEDRLSVTGNKGYTMVRATHGISSGFWYFECKIVSLPGKSAARIGWSQDVGNLQAPIGFDKFSYSIRTKKGTIFHNSRGKHYTDSGFEEGDVLGVEILLPTDSTKILKMTPKNEPLIKFKGHLYFEQKDEIELAEKNLQPYLNSAITFYKNGMNLGTAFSNINRGIYYPAISLYNSATVTVNFGPHFEYASRKMESKPVSERALSEIIEQALNDVIYFVTNHGKLRLDMVVI